ncbi:MAG TPA: hypothetical protein VFI31_02450, partial [Pirellulales bacterium]|nr:hypothetical protein [Pirellulales bacterium]
MPNREFLAVYGLLGIVLLGTAAARADNTLVGPALESQFRKDAAQLAGHYVSGAMAEAQASAAAEALTWQQEQLGQGGAGGVIGLLRGLPAEERKELTDILAKGGGPVVATLEKQVEAATARRKQLAQDWLQTRSALYHQQLELYEVKANQQIAGQMASLLSVDNRWFWLFGLIAIASLASITLLERRHELRRWLFGGRARALGLSKFLTALLAIMTLVTLSTFVLGDRVYQWLLQAGMGDEVVPRQTFRDQNEKIDAALTQAKAERAAAEAKYKAAFDKWKSSQATEGPPAGLLEQNERQRQFSLRLAEELATTRKVAAAIAADLKDLDTANAETVRSAEQRDAYLRQKQWIRGGLGGALLGLTTAGGLAFRRGLRSRRRKTRDTCPLCLGEGTFEPLGDETHPGLEMARCKNVISEHPYEECDFTFSAMYRDNVKLCFPTLGIPQAGKTHWLAMVYRELNRGNYPNVIQFERIRSTSSDDFDVVVDEILNKKLGPMATQVGRIPHPLIFNFLDHDRFGASNVLVNIFDYSGEVIRSQTIEDRQRQRALDGDGFFFFLDPTEPSETQSQALAGFREDLRRIKGVRAGKQVQVPIALCVSKIDLMVNQ